MITDARDWIEAHGCHTGINRAVEQDLFRRSCPPAAQCAGIRVEWRNADQCSHLLVGKCAGWGLAAASIWASHGCCEFVRPPEVGLPRGRRCDSMAARAHKDAQSPRGFFLGAKYSRLRGAETLPKGRPRRHVALPRNRCALVWQGSDTPHSRNDLDRAMPENV